MTASARSSTLHTGAQMDTNATRKRPGAFRNRTITYRLLTMMLYLRKPWIARQVSPDGLWIRVRALTGPLTVACSMRGNNRTIEYFRWLEDADLVRGLRYDRGTHQLELYIPNPSAHGATPDGWREDRWGPALEYGKTRPPSCGLPATWSPTEEIRHDAAQDE